MKRVAAMPSLEVISADEWHMLNLHPYDESISAGAVTRKKDIEIARRLIERGLLERDPTATSLYVRCTEKGQDAVRPLSIAGARRAVDAIIDLAADDLEAAEGQHRALVHRALLRAATHPGPDAEKVAAIVMEIELWRRDRGR